MRRRLLGLAALAARIVALGASGDEPRAKAQQTAATKKSELPPLPKLRPKWSSRWPETPAVPRSRPIPV